MTTPKILTEEEVNDIENGFHDDDDIERFIFSLRASRQEVETLKAENARLKEAIPGEEEIEKASLEYDESDIGEQITFRDGARWLRSRLTETKEG